MSGAALLQVAAMALLNGGFGWLAGLLLTLQLQALPSAGPGGGKAQAAGAAVSLAGAIGVLWATAALMGDSGLGEAATMIWPVAVGTAVGQSVLAGTAALLLAAGTARRWPALGAILLLLYVLVRAAVSHGGAGGMVSVGYAVDAAHLWLVGIWFGVVAVAGWCALGQKEPPDHALGQWLGRLSATAAFALAGIVASGLWNSWHRLTAPAELWTHPWGVLLSIKLGLFLAAALLGAWNRWIGFPRAARGQRRGAILVLRIESLILFCTLIAAAALATRQPPG